MTHPASKTGLAWKACDFRALSSVGCSFSFSEAPYSVRYALEALQLFAAPPGRITKGQKANRTTYGSPALHELHHSFARDSYMSSAQEQNNDSPQVTTEWFCIFELLLCICQGNGKLIPLQSSLWSLLLFAGHLSATKFFIS